jgi:hypothetical protein
MEDQNRHQDPCAKSLTKTAVYILEDSNTENALLNLAESRLKYENPSATALLRTIEFYLTYFHAGALFRLCSDVFLRHPNSKQGLYTDRLILTSDSTFEYPL